MRRDTRERGSVTVEMVLLAPVLLTTLFAGIQTGLVFHARQVAIAAAQEGVRVAAAYDADLPDGLSTAQALASDWGRGALADIQVTGSRTTTRASITVTGTAVNLLPGLDWPVEQTATLPVERT